jgi:hypothetical protein
MAPTRSNAPAINGFFLTVYRRDVLLLRLIHPDPSTSFFSREVRQVRLSVWTSNASQETHTISGGTPISYNNPLSQRTVPTAMPSLPTPIARRSGGTSALKSAHTGSVSAIMDDSILPSDHAAVMDALGLDDDDNCGNNEIATNVSTNSPRLSESASASELERDCETRKVQNCGCLNSR